MSHLFFLILLYSYNIYNPIQPSQKHINNTQTHKMKISKLPIKSNHPLHPIKLKATRLKIQIKIHKNPQKNPFRPLHHPTLPLYFLIIILQKQFPPHSSPKLKHITQKETHNIPHNKPKIVPMPQTKHLKRQKTSQISLKNRPPHPIQAKNSLITIPLQPQMSPDIPKSNLSIEINTQFHFKNINLLNSIVFFYYFLLFFIILTPIVSDSCEG